jgi:hypothetical protein
MSPSKDRDVEVDDRTRERRHRSKSEKKDRERDKDRDKDKESRRDRDKDKDKDKEHRHRSSKSRSKPTDSETGSRSHRRHRTTEGEKEPRDRDRDPDSVVGSASVMTDLVPELLRGTMSTDRISIPYPTFSKAHSKEFVHSKEDVSMATQARRTDPPTPEATDLGGSELKRSNSVDSPSVSRRLSSRKVSRKEDRPPSPPETDLSAEKKRSGTPSSARDEIGEERPRSRTSMISRSTMKNDSKSKLSKVSSQATFIMSPPLKSPSGGNVAEATSEAPSEAPSTSRSAATSIPPKRTPSLQPSRLTTIEADDSPESAPDSSPKTPIATPQFPPSSMLPQEKTPAGYNRSSDVPTPPARAGPPPPPPPPPPPLNIQEPPRVDYLMQNGGLPNPVPRSLLAALPRQNGYRPSVPPLRGAETLFAPFFNLLDQYQTVLSGHGSIAVATGHRTVARRLLDRLENVFSRDLSPDGCSCVMCEQSDEPHRGLGWGEVLERVSGRIDLPSWPPFDLALVGTKAAEDIADMPARPSSPVNMDPDIAEEFREHYLRQTKKVRASVDRWMSNCDKAPAPAPQEIDDETLNFAILTNIEQDARPFFNALLSGSRELQPTVRAPTPLRKPRNDFMVKTGLSLQRLYRLQAAPRDAEAAVYLVRNPPLHDLLHTISEINPSEWEILTSGRFDGFLWSGADDELEAGSRRPTPASGIMPPPRGGTLSPSMGRYTPGLGSRNTTPFSPYSRGATPASFISGMSTTSSSYPNRAAVSHDEETELAALAEVEREIFAGMEALEDAFETLHRKAEIVRTSLRQRQGGLSMSLQHRRAGIDVLPNQSGGPGWWAIGDDDRDSIVSESDWGGDDASELAPDDSASNISSSRHRRPKRRKERATPAPIEEEEEREE